MQNRVFVAKHQQGSALIAVLFILVVITIIGSIAIRQGMTSLSIATNTQVQSVLFQTADRGIDQIYLNLDSAPEVTLAQSAFGMIGLPQNTGNEIVMCLSPNFAVTPNLLDTSRLAQNRISEAGVLENLDGAGYCDVGSASDYLTDRKVTITQLALLVPTDADRGPAFSTAIDGTDGDVLFGSNAADATNPKDQPLRLRVYSTSITPALSQLADTAEMNACLRKMNDPARAALASTALDQETVTDCLTKEGIPFATHTEEYLQRPTSNRDRNSCGKATAC